MAALKRENGMLLGQSLFQSVVNRLEEEAKDEDETGLLATDFRVRGLGASFVVPLERHASATDADLDAYLAFLPEEMPEAPDEAALSANEPPPPVPQHLLRLTEAEITEDLAITDKDTEATLADKRRQFARQNHPDMVAAEFRANATTRMTIANQQIDRAIEALFWK